MRKAVYGVTGSRRGSTRDQRASLLIRISRISDQLDRKYEPWLIHGGCKGIDTETHNICKGFGWKTWVLPGPHGADPSCIDADIIENPRAFLERNHLIVDRCGALHALPFEHHEVQRSGTWATIRYAKKIKKRLMIIWPNGEISSPIYQ